jgi:organic hydroperoxide reductase OsmC/OhrA
VGEVRRGGAGRFVKVTLRPHVVVAPGADLAVAEAIHHRIHEVCFIARSVNFSVDYAPTFAVGASGGDI